MSTVNALTFHKIYIKAYVQVSSNWQRKRCDGSRLCAWDGTFSSPRCRRVLAHSMRFRFRCIRKFGELACMWALRLRIFYGFASVIFIREFFLLLLGLAMRSLGAGNCILFFLSRSGIDVWMFISSFFLRDHRAVFTSLPKYYNIIVSL